MLARGTSPGAPTISIALATYNGRAYIEPLLASLARQSAPPHELVVTDDQSCDDTTALVDAFARTAPFAVRLYRNERRLGYRANFLKAAGLCTGACIAFCDQDDVWQPEKLAVCGAYFDSSEVLLLHHNARIVSASATPIGVLDPDPSDRISDPLTLRPWEFALGFTEVFRAELLQFSGLWPLSRDQNKAAAAMGHDQWVFFLSSVFGKTVRCGKCLVDYRQHASNVFGWVHPSGLMSKLRYSLARRAEVFGLCSADMAQRAAVLRAAAAQLDDACWRSRATVAAASFEKLAELYAHRQAVYGSPQIRQRHAALQCVKQDHGYDEDGAWTFRQRAHLRDFVKGVLLGLLLDRFGLQPPGGDPECYPAGAGLEYGRS